MLIAKHLVYGNGMWEGGAPITPPIRPSFIISSRLPKNCNSVVAFVSTRRRLREIIVPFGLASKVYINETLPPKDWIGLIPQRLRPGITHLRLTCYICRAEEISSRRHRGVPKDSCIGNYARGILTHLPNLHFLYLEGQGAFFIRDTLKHRCVIGSHPRLHLPKLLDISFDSEAAECVFSSPWLLPSAPILSAIRILENPFAIRRSAKTFGWSYLTAKQIPHFRQMRKLQLPCLEFNNGPLEAFNPSKLVSIAESCPYLLELGLSSNRPRSLLAVKVTCQGTIGAKKSQLIRPQLNDAISNLAVFTCLERLGPLFVIVAAPDSLTMRPPPKMDLFSTETARHMSDSLVRYVNEERQHLRRVVKSVAESLKIVCPTLRSGGVWIQNQETSEKWWWEFWVVQQPAGVELVETAFAGIAERLLL